MLEDLKQAIQKTLADVKAAVEDWPEMRGRVGEIVSGLGENPPDFEPEDLAETRAFLEWIDDDNFTFLGYREYDLTTQNGEEALCAVQGSGLGILRQTESGPVSRSFAELPPGVRRLARAPKLLNLTKANSRATVHRPSYLDYIGVKKFDESGEVTGERRFLGLYTFTAYSASAFDIPLVRRKVRYVLERAGFPEGSHNEKDLHRDPGDLPARRAVPDLQGGALRDSDGHTPPAGAPARQALRQARHLRALLLLPRLRAPRPLQHRDPGTHAGHTPAGPSTARTWSSTSGSRSPCSHASTSSSTRSRERPRNTTRSRSKPTSSRRPARGRTTSTTP